MKLTFRGVARQVYVHDHDCNGMRWHSGLEATATIFSVGLSGDFHVSFGFEEHDINSWAEKIVKSSPELALRIANKMQAESIINLSNRLENNAKAV